MAAPSLSRHMFQFSKAEDLQELMLRIWELGSPERELTHALAIIAEILRPLLQCASFGLLYIAEGHLRLHGLIDKTRSTDGGQQQLRPEEYTPCPSLQRQRLFYDVAELKRRCHSGKPFTCPDLLARNAWYEHEFQLANAGVRAYVSLPLIFKGKIVGSAFFGRSAPRAFETEELLILRGIAPAVSGVIANVLENKRVGDRCIQLESENLELRSQSAQVPPKDALVFLRDRMDDAEPDNCQSPVQIQISARLEEEERRLIVSALHSTNGRISGPKGAAVRLGIPSSTLEFRIRRLGIDKFQYRRGHQAEL